MTGHTDGELSERSGCTSTQQKSAEEWELKHWVWIHSPRDREWSKRKSRPIFTTSQESEKYEEYEKSSVF